jgi:hypothetical protein
MELADSTRSPLIALALHHVGKTRKVSSPVVNPRVDSISHRHQEENTSQTTHRKLVGAFVHTDIASLSMELIMAASSRLAWVGSVYVLSTNKSSGRTATGAGVKEE